MTTGPNKTTPKNQDDFDEDFDLDGDDDGFGFDEEEVPEEGD